MTTIYIHAGMHKTGTTAIQTTLFRHRRSLLKHDVNYFSIGPNHSTSLAPMVMEAPHLWPLNIRAGIDTAEKAQRRNKAIETTLRRELVRNVSARFVISGEELLSLTPSALAALKGKLEPYASAIRAIVYVREPYTYISSAFQELLRHGHDWDFLVAHSPGPGYRRIKKLIDTFGRDRVHIRVFDRSNFQGGNVVTDFLSAIELDPSVVKTLAPTFANESLSHEATLVLKAINKLYPTPRGAKINRQIDTNLLRVLKTIKGRPFRCPNAVFVRLGPVLEKDIAWLNRICGYDVFLARPVTQDEYHEEWSEAALASAAKLLNELSKDSKLSIRRLWRDAPTSLGKARMLIADWIIHRRAI